MFKHPRYLLSNPDLAPVLVGKRWGLRPLMVLARHLCLSFQLDARGMPWHRTAAFVALQGTRLAPFIDPAGAFVRHGDVVHVWSWPAALRNEAQARISASERHFDVIPESLLGPVPADGAVFRSCVSGMEALRFERGRLTKTAWWPQPVDLQVQSAWADAATIVDEPRNAELRASGGALWPARWKPWTPPQLSQRPIGTASRYAGNVMLLAGLAAACVSVGQVGYAFREHQLLLSGLDEAQKSLDGAVARATARASKPVIAPTASADDSLWQQAQVATRGLQVERIWSGLAKVLGDSGYVLRDFSFERDEVKLTVVSAYGGDVDLGSATLALESSGLWRRIEILDFSNPAVVRFGAKPLDHLFAASTR